MLKPILTLSIALTAASAFAGTAEVAKTAPKEKSALDKLWDLPVLYKNDKNPILEELDFTGRFQLDWFGIDTDNKPKAFKEGDIDYTEIRRFRLGIDSWWADRHVQLKATVDTALASYHKQAVFYNRMTDLYLNFKISEALQIRAGKFEPHFGFDREYSDNLQKFSERSFYDEQIFNNTGNDYAAGASVLGKIGNWGYQAAVFSDNVNKEFGIFNGGMSELFEVSYDFAKAMGAQKALWAFDYLHVQGLNVNSNVFNTMHNAAATYFDYQNGRFGLVTQIGFGNGTKAKGDLWGFQIMPTFYLIPEKLELVTRYQYGTSDNANGITTLGRQVSNVGKFTGDTYNSAYVGLNYYVYGQKAKFMVGGQYDELTGGTGKNANYRGWTMLVGFRVFW
jgi:hypothetical protein